MLYLLGNLKTKRFPSLGCSACLEAAETELLGEKMSPPGRLHSAPLGEKSALPLSIKPESKGSDLAPHLQCAFILSHPVSEGCPAPKYHPNDLALSRSGSLTKCFLL